MGLDIDRQGLEERRHVAEKAARAAGQALLHHYTRRDLLNIEQKGINDFVSNADKEAEDIITKIMSTSFPNDGILGEETGLSGPADAQAVWCVDPLDGTTNFLKGAHNWCVSIGLWNAGKSVVGVIYDPFRDEMFSGIVGSGATCNGKPIAVRTIDRLDRASVGFGHNRRIGIADFCRDTELLLSAGAGFRQVGAGALMLAYVAAGRVDIYLERHMWAWDAMAGLALIEAAGGKTGPYITHAGNLPRGGFVLAGSSSLFDVVERNLSLTADLNVDI